MVAIITRTPWLDQRVNIVRFRKAKDMVNGSTFAEGPPPHLATSVTRDYASGNAAP
jgi:hypothetical protein